jgi:hypothetical protein
VVVANFLIAMLIASLLGFAIIDILARSLAADDAKAARETEYPRPAGPQTPENALARNVSTPAPRSATRA